MRRRLVSAFVGLAVAVILLLGIPRAYVVVELVKSERQGLLDRTAQAASAVVSDAVRDGDPVDASTLAALVGEGERLEYLPEDGPAIVVPVGTSRASESDLVAQRPVTGGGEVTASYPRATLRGDVIAVLSPLVLLASTLIGLAAVAGWLLARRLARPFTELAHVADQFGRGRLDAGVPRYEMPEADAIARALEGSAARLRRMLRREREVSDYASHDLRTPITALRLTLEDLALWPDTPPEVREELCRLVGEVDRFSDAVAGLVEPQPVAETPERVDLAAVVRESVAEHQGSGALGARLRSGSSAPVLARLPSRGARRAVDLLLEQAVRAGGGEVVATARDGTGYVTVEAQGAAGAVKPTQGVVWDQVVGLAAELGGRTEYTEASGGRATWRLTLPKAPELR